MPQTEAPVKNKVAKSGLITLDLQEWYDGLEVVGFDLKDFLHMELILKEKAFREALDAYDWEAFRNKTVAVYCSTDAIIPKWAYMLVVQHAQEHVRNIYFGTRKDALSQLFKEKLDLVDWSDYQGKFVLLKGCSKMDVPPDVYMYATQKLLPHVQKLMYGEACSNVPVYKKPR